MKKIFILLIAFFSSYLFPNQNTSGKKDLIIKVGAFDYYPAIFKDTDGEVKGFIVDMLKDVAKNENWKLEYIFGSWNDCLSKGKRGELDLLTSVAFTKERAEYFLYTKEEILTVWSEVYTSAESDIENIRGLEGKKIAIMRGDFNGRVLIDLLNSFKIRSDIVECVDFSTIFKMINTNQADAGVVNSSYGSAKSNEYKLKSTGIVFNPFSIYFAAPKEKSSNVLQTLNNYLSKWKEDRNSVYFTSIKNWSYQKVNIISNSPMWLITTLIIIAIVLILSFAFIYLLRKRVRKATEKVEKSEAEIRTILNSLDDVVFTLDINQKHTGVYGKWLNKNGISANTFIGKTSADILGEERSKIHSEANNIAFKGEDIIYEWSFESNGTVTYTHTSLSPIKDKNDKVIGLVGVGRDISSLKRIENDLREEKKRMQMIIEGTPFLFFYTQDINGNITYISPSVEQISGYSVDDWKSRTDWFTTENEINRIAREKTHAHLRGEIDHSIIPMEILSASGKIILLEIYENPIIENGVVCGLHGVAHNVTERVIAETNLKKKSDELDNYFNNSLDLLCIANKEGEFVRLNPEWEKVLGIKIKDLIGRKYIEFIHPGDIEITLQTAQRLNNEEEILSFTNRYRCNDGSYRWIEWRAKSLGDNIYAVARDVTEQRKSFDELKRNAKILKLFVQHAPASIAMFDKNMRYIVTSKQFINDYDLDYEDLTGLWHYEVFPEIPERWRKIHSSGLSGNIEKSNEDIFIRANGNQDWVRWEIHPWFESDGEIGGIILFSEVITEQKKSADAIRESEELFKMIFNASSYAIGLSDIQSGRYLDINSAFEKIFEYTKEEVIGVSSLDLGVWVSKDDRKKIIALIEENGLVDEFECQFRTKSGQIIDTKATARFLTINDNKFLLSIIEDITERKQAESELQKYRLHLEELIESRTMEIDSINKQLQESLLKEKELSGLKSRFISTASHEFRTPLTSIQMSAELLQRYYERWDRYKIDEHLNRIKNQTSALTRLMDDVIKVNRAESGRTILEPSIVNLYTLCYKVIDELEIQLNERHKLIFNYTGNRGNYYVDGKQIETIINNLLSNAIKYSPNGGDIILNVSTENDVIEINIKDSGIGIPEEDLPRLFEPFHRSKNTIDIQGTGLGLSIVKHAVDLHNGTIEVDSKENVGTSFIVKIPSKREN